MDEISGCLVLAALNLEISLAYLKDTEDGVPPVVEKLEYCLKLIKEIRQYELLSYHRQHFDSGEYVELTCPHEGYHFLS